MLSIKQWFRWLQSHLFVEDFFALFKEQANVGRECLPILNAIRNADAVSPDWDDIIQDIEHRADTIVSKIIVCAEDLYSTPFDTEDIYELAIRFDDVIDIVEDLCVKVVDYQFVLDDTLKQFFDYVIRGLDHTCNGLYLLQKFQHIPDLRDKMRECEHAADRMIRPIIRQSRTITLDDLLPFCEDRYITRRELSQVVDRYTYYKKYREIAELAEEAVDACTKVFHVLGNIYIKKT